MKRSKFTESQIILTIALLLLIISSDCREETKPTLSRPVNVPLDSALYGIDVSHHQKRISWDKVKSWKKNRIAFVYIKATEGATHDDSMYKTNLEGARANGFPVGSYHYFRTTSSPQKQFENFKSVVDLAKQDLIPLVDVEEKKEWDLATFHKNFKLFLNLVEGHFGKKPMIYTVNSFYNKYLAGNYKDYHFLIGRYDENQPFMKDDHRWTIWQFTDEATVEGIPKPVDIDVLNPEIKFEELLLGTKP